MLEATEKKPDVLSVETYAGLLASTICALEN